MGYLSNRLFRLRLKAWPVHFQSHVRISASVTAIRLSETQRCRKEQNAYKFRSIVRLGPHGPIWVQLGFELNLELLDLVAIARAIIGLKTSDYLEHSRIPVTLDVGFEDALADATRTIDYPSLLDMEQPKIRSYPPETVIAEKFQDLVALGLANGRMKEFWAVLKSLAIEQDALDAAIAANVERPETPIPQDRPVGLSVAMAEDPLARQRWKAYLASLEQPHRELGEVIDDIWTTLEPSCARLAKA